ncbi:MAG TPA: alpha/beta fold hydrolase [Aliidongia sp.]|uniref:alpha/beta fold hydrolase n=1 Tax=Aliidongia sp. TaxID=1914230 RepID=UPI002DDDBB61|nr:alpha/beta fold hydrolase [Aliidongia sp.]HEV2673292.1 alpha/beta fold hydrolase [Aliidongia sp.]
MSGAVAERARPATRKIDFRYLDLPTRSPACYLEIGPPDAPALVFLHGFGGDLLTWHFCLVAFSSRFRVIALDLPGHGRSTMDVGRGTLAEMVAWIDQALAALGIETADFVGHSMGGKIAIALALAHPSRVRSLSLISPAGLGGPFDLALLHRFLDCTDQDTALDLSARLVGSDSPALIGSLAKSLVSSNGPAQRRAFETLLGEVAAIGEAISDTGVPWAQIACPIQIAWGEADTILPLPERHRLPPGAPFTPLPGVGHLPQIECPGVIVSLLRRFLP